MTKRVLLYATLSVLFLGSAASAQEAGEVGFNFRAGDQDSVGVTWHITHGFAFRPLLTYSSQEVTFLDPFFGTFQQTVREYGTDLGFLFTVRSEENLNLYAGFALQYVYNDVDFGGSFHSEGAEALFGMRYTFAKRFGVFGEVGARYRRDDAPADRTEYGLFTGGLGMIIYLNRH
jgi:hypothetical protein